MQDFAEPFLTRGRDTRRTYSRYFTSRKNDRLGSMLCYNNVGPIFSIKNMVQLQDYGLNSMVVKSYGKEC